MKVLDVVHSGLGKVVICQRDDRIDTAKAISINGTMCGDFKVGEQRSFGGPIKTSIILVSNETVCDIGDVIEFVD